MTVDNKGESGIPTLELQALMRRGLQEHKAGRLQEAKEAYQQVLDAEPGHADANHLLGVLAHQMGAAEIAVRLISKAVQKDSSIAGYHGNLGYALHALGRLEEAVTSYHEALRIDPNFSEAHMNLGNALAQQDRPTDAIASYHRALEIDPNYAEAHNNLGTLLQTIGQFEDAIPHFLKNNDENAKSRVLECLYGAGRIEEYNDLLSYFCRSDPTNRRVAAISTFAAHQLGTHNPYPFCKAPLKFIYNVNVTPDLAPFDGFFAKIIQEIENATTVWEPLDNAARGGFHTIGNLFDMDTPAISELRNIIGERVEEYRNRYATQKCGLIRRWPLQSKFYGWHVKLLNNGHMDAHYHPSGWLSGVFYLRSLMTLKAMRDRLRFRSMGITTPYGITISQPFSIFQKMGISCCSRLPCFTTPLLSSPKRSAIASRSM